MTDAALFIFKRCVQRQITLFRVDGAEPLAWEPADAMTPAQKETLRENRDGLLAICDAIWDGKIRCPWCKEPLLPGAELELMDGELAHYACVIELVDCLFGRAA